MTRARTKWLATTAVVAAVGAAGTFGLVSVAGATPGRVTTAKHATRAVTTASFTFSLSVTGLTPSAVSITGSGQADFATDTASLALTVPASVASLIPGGTAAPVTVDAVLSGGTIYLEIPALSSLVGEPWISVALPTKAKAEGAKLLSKAAIALGDVPAIAAFATAKGATVSSLGSSTVDNVAVTGTKIADSGATHGIAGSIAADLWADHSGRLVQADVTASATGAKVAPGLTATIDFTGYGAPVTVTVPPANQVKSIPLSTIEQFVGKHHRTHRA